MINKQSFLKMNTFLKVSTIKINSDNDTVNFQTAFKNRNKMSKNTVLQTNFYESQSNNINSPTILAKYFPPKDSKTDANFTIYKKTPEQKYYNYICSLQNGEYQFTDYNIANNKFYQYLAVIQIKDSDNTFRYEIYQNEDEYGEPCYYKTQWNYWSICDIEEVNEDNGNIFYQKIGNTWLLKFNIADENLQQNLSITSQENLSRFPKFYKGSKNYISGTFTGLLGDISEQKHIEVEYKDIIINNKHKQDKQIKKVNSYTEKINTPYYENNNPQSRIINEYARENEKAEAWRKFCNSGNLKLLKDIKGNAWIVQIINTPVENINLMNNNMPTTISFDWQEADDINSAAIVKLNNENKGD